MFGMTPMVGRYRSVIIFSPVESVSSVRPSGVGLLSVTLVLRVIFTFSFLSSFAANLTTLGGTIPPKSSSADEI